MQGNLACKFGFAFCNIGIQNALCHRLLALSIQQKCSLHKVNIYEKFNLPPKPKKPITAFLRFLIHIRPTILKEHPDMKYTGQQRFVSGKVVNNETT